MKGVQAPGEAPSIQKRTSSPFPFFLHLWGIYFPPGSGSRRPEPMRIRIRNTGSCIHDTSMRS
jgi:hypothetical protein